MVIKFNTKIPLYELEEYLRTMLEGIRPIIHIGTVDRQTKAGKVVKVSEMDAGEIDRRAAKFYPHIREALGKKEVYDAFIKKLVDQKEGFEGVLRMTLPQGQIRVELSKDREGIDIFLPKDRVGTVRARIYIDDQDNM
ncbi:MAG: hypothetical protein ABII22_02575 [Candidatus Micrarchaeota archaeon]